MIGTPVANRGQIETEGLIGFFVNMLALRIDVSGSASVVELLRQVKEQVLAAQQHQDIPFEQVVEVVQPLRRQNSGTVKLLSRPKEKAKRRTHRRASIGWRKLNTLSVAPAFCSTIAAAFRPSSDAASG